MTAILEIRRATPSDASAIYLLRRETFERVNAPDYSGEIIRILNTANTQARVLEKMADREMFCLVKRTRNDELLLGTIDLKENRIGGLFVRYNYIRKGCGSTLLLFIEKYAKEKGIKILKGKCTKYAKPFYTSQGYQIQESSLEMEKTLCN